MMCPLRGTEALMDLSVAVDDEGGANAFFVFVPVLHAVFCKGTGYGVVQYDLLFLTFLRFTQRTEEDEGEEEETFQVLGEPDLVIESLKRTR